MLLRVASNYFEYSRVERISATTLLVALFIVYSFPFAYRSLWKAPTEDFSAFHESFQATVPMAQYVPEEQGVSTPPPSFPFDPNTASLETLTELGFPTYLAERLIKYRSKGGKFRKPEDLAKLYGIKPTLLDRLLPLVKIKRHSSVPERASRKSTSEKALVVPPEPFVFDPNRASREEFVQLGLSERVAQQVLNYRAKGGTFRRPEDFGKLYHLRSEDYERLLPFIEIAADTASVGRQNFAATRNFDRAPERTYLSSVAVNTATLDEWKQLRGLSTYHAERIVRFREALGGFTSLEQIAETYNLPDSVYQTILPTLQLSGPLTKIDLNTVDVETLQKHPYLKWKQAKAIINYRKHHGPFLSQEDFAPLRVPLGKVYDQLLPYLDFKDDSL